MIVMVDGHPSRSLAFRAVKEAGISERFPPQMASGSSTFRVIAPTSAGPCRSWSLVWGGGASDHARQQKGEPQPRQHCSTKEQPDVTMCGQRTMITFLCEGNHGRATGGRVGVQVYEIEGIRPRSFRGKPNLGVAPYDPVPCGVATLRRGDHTPGERDSVFAPSRPLPYPPVPVDGPRSWLSVFGMHRATIASCWRRLVSPNQ